MLRRMVLAAFSGLLLASASANASGESVRPPADAVNFESIEQLKALAAKGPAILYFHAEWCPTCKAAMVNFRGRWGEVQPGITLVIADYDREIELKTTYGVTYQNSYVQVGSDGEKLQIWNGGGIEALNERPVFAAQ
ncbi:thioredoxin family protein [Mesorhizobium sp. CAU 1732]|uniref:thioredoxin family protein n=1 Tax=Mesorhizobium sp. CAU 1732 TaxID=3140358 RepID=UPI00325FF95E